MEVPMKTQFNAPFKDLQLKAQQCNVVGLALSWIAYVAGLGYLSYRRHWLGAALWMVGVPCLRWAQYHFFPSISRFLGYGRIVDKFASLPQMHFSPGTQPVAVNFYSFFSCPFCPIVLARLEALQKQVAFTLKTIDVTLNPQMLLTKGIRSVPVVEVGDHRLVGNSTTEQLAGLIALGQTPKLSQANIA
jgi:thiol-disulfide isomerase/thioredoxin